MYETIHSATDDIIEEYIRISGKYGLNITKTLDASSFKRTEQAPKAKGFWQWLLW